MHFHENGAHSACPNIWKRVTVSVATLWQKIGKLEKCRKIEVFQVAVA